MPDRYPKHFRIAAAISAILLLSAFTPERHHPVKLLSPLKFQGAEIKDSEAVAFDRYYGFAPATLDSILLARDGHQKNVTSCAEYLEARDSGFHPDSNMEVRQEGFFVFPCEGLRLLEKGNASARTHFSANFPTSEDISKLTIIFANNAQFETSGCSQRDDADGCLEKMSGTLSVDKSSIHYQDRHAFGIYTPVMLADFNDDGWEDVALSATTGSNHGTLVDSRYLCLEQIFPQQFSEIKCLKKLD